MVRFCLMGLLSEADQESKSNLSFEFSVIISLSIRCIFYYLIPTNKKKYKNSKEKVSECGSSYKLSYFKGVLARHPFQGKKKSFSSYVSSFVYLRIFINLLFLFKLINLF